MTGTIGMDFDPTNEDYVRQATRQGDWWETRNPGRCWICQGETRWVWLDQGHQHPTCDMWPSEHGTNLAVVVISGVQVTCDHGYDYEHDWEEDGRAYVCLGKDEN